MAQGRVGVQRHAAEFDYRYNEREKLASMMRSTVEDDETYVGGKAANRKMAGKGDEGTLLKRDLQFF